MKEQSKIDNSEKQTGNIRQRQTKQKHITMLPLYANKHK